MRATSVERYKKRVFGGVFRGFKEKLEGSNPKRRKVDLTTSKTRPQPESCVYLEVRTRLLNIDFFGFFSFCFRLHI